jgi:hypothetical protein
VGKTVGETERGGEAVDRRERDWRDRDWRANADREQRVEPRVLAVDDDEGVRAMLGAALEVVGACLGPRVAPEAHA